MSDTDSESDVPRRFRVDFTGVTLLGVYRVEEKLAEGGMGSIYRAEDTNLGRRVVVKVPHPRFLGEPGFRARFAREVTELVRLEHPNIVRILAQGEHDEIPFFVLQFLGGGSLQDRLAAAPGRTSTPVDVLEWLVPVARTLDFVHGEGVVHRDVKPANVLFDESGHVFLSDFGVAKVLSEVGEITGTGTGLGSPLYMPPEQGAGGEVGPAADQYSLASVVYEALAGRPPFEGGTPLQVLVQKAREDPTPLTEVAPEVPARAAEAVMRALSREPGDRYGSCRDFSDSFATGAGLTSGFVPAPEIEGFEVPRARSRSTWIVVAALLLLAVGGLVVGFAGNGDGSAPEPSDGAGSFGYPELVSPGAEPHAPLRYRPVPGAIEHQRVEAVQKMSMRRGKDRKLDAPPIPMSLSSDLDVLSVGEDGIRYRVTFGRMQLTAPGAPGRVPEEVMSQAKGLSVVGAVNACGMGDAPEVEGREDLDPEGLELVKKMVFGVDRVVVPLPRDGVGIGARWERTEVVESFGMRVTQTVTYELVERTGNVIRLKLALAQTAPPQSFESPLFPGTPLEIREFHSGGKGEAVLDLGHLVPNRLTLEVVSDTRTHVKLEGEEFEVEMHREATTETTREDE